MSAMHAALSPAFCCWLLAVGLACEEKPFLLIQTLLSAR